MTALNPNHAGDGVDEGSRVIIPGGLTVVSGFQWRAWRLTLQLEAASPLLPRGSDPPS